MLPRTLALLLVGIASLCAPLHARAQAVGYAAGTTGGGDRTPVLVSTPEQMRAALSAYSGSGGLVIRYTGTFDFSTIPDPCAQWQKDPVVVEVKDQSDITIEGADGSSANFGIFIVGNSRNIIVRNMTIGLLPGGEGADSITVEGRGAGRTPERIWIDHNTIFATRTSCPGAGDASFDGGIDIKRGARFVTVSYNHVFNYQKVALNGHTDSFPGHDAARTTYYRNRFENVQSRVPLQRFGLSHIANNYFGNITTSGINVRMGGVALVEANYFENVANPLTSRDSSEIGYWDVRGNLLGTGITWSSSGGGTVNATTWQTTRAFPEPLGYTLPIAPAEQVKCLVFATAGAGTRMATTAPECAAGAGGVPSIALTLAASPSSIDLAWVPSNLSPGTQEIYRDTDANPAGRTRIASVGSSVRSYTDASASSGVTYWYWVSTTTGGQETTSNSASATRAPLHQAPSIHLAGMPSSSGIQLAWKPSNSTTGPQAVYRNTDADPAGRTRIGTIDANARSFGDASATPGVTYWYWIDATIDGQGTTSNAASAVLPAPRGGADGATPDAFTFAARRGVPLSSTVTSEPVTLRGLSGPALLTVTNGMHSVGCSATYTSEPATITAGQVVCLRHTSAVRNGVTTTTTVTIGGASAEFQSTTVAGTGPRTADQFDVSGAWYEPSTSGQGLMIELYASTVLAEPAPYLFAGWFTYTDRVGGAAEQDWYVLEGSGDADGRVFDLTIGRPSAGGFDDGASVGAPLPHGTATLTFSSCTEAVLDYQFDAASGSRSGQVVLQRLLSDVSCEEATPVANAPRGFLNSGAWFDPASAGQGFVLEVNPVDRQLLGAWYTFAPGGQAGYRWYTLQLGDIDPTASRIASVPIYESTGGRFDRADATRIRQVGEASIAFSSCSTGRISYAFTAGELAGRAGEVSVSRVGPAPVERHKGGIV